MALARDDRYLTDALGRALAGAEVWWCTQPASTATNPPSPLASIFTDLTGSTPLTQPVITDGFGHADAYMNAGVLYTVVLWHPLFGPYPVVLKDQSLGGGGGGGGSTVTAFAGGLLGTIDGTNKTFVLSNAGTALTTLPTQQTVWLNFPQIQGIGYSGPALVGGQATIVFATAPQPAAGSVAGDSLWGQGFYVA